MMTHSYLTDKQLALEEELQERLKLEWIEYKASSAEKKKEARERYLETLRSFSRIVNPH
jgi:hypothetical protein